MAPCSATPNPAQQWTVAPQPSNVTLRLAASPTFCANVAGYGTSTGSQVWLYTCNENDCKGNCLWDSGPAGHEVVNPISGLCLSDGDVPLMPQTCAPGSPSYGAAYCNSSLPFSDRVDALWDAMSPQERLYFFSIPIRVSARTAALRVCTCAYACVVCAALPLLQPNDFNSELNLKSFYWDITGIAGLSPGNSEC